MRNELSKPLLDPLRFAYRVDGGGEDATATLLKLLLNDLEAHGSLIFGLDFTSAFNPAQPRILSEKLMNSGSLDFWIFDFWTSRTQTARVNGCQMFHASHYTSSSRTEKTIAVITVIDELVRWIFSSDFHQRGPSSLKVTWWILKKCISILGLW